MAAAADADRFEDALTAAAGAISSFHDHAAAYAAWMEDGDAAVYGSVVQEQWETVRDAWADAYEAHRALDTLIDAVGVEKPVDTGDAAADAILHVAGEDDDELLYAALGMLIQEDETPPRTMPVRSLSDLIDWTYLREREQPELAGLEEGYTPESPDPMGYVVSRYEELSAVHFEYVHAVQLIEEAGALPASENGAAASWADDATATVPDAWTSIGSGGITTTADAAFAAATVDHRPAGTVE